MAFPETTNLQKDILQGGSSYTKSLNPESTKDAPKVDERLTRKLIRKFDFGNGDYSRLIGAAGAVGTMTEGIGTVGDVIGNLKLVSVSSETAPNDPTKFIVTQEYIDEASADDKKTDSKETGTVIKSLSIGTRLASAKTTKAFFVRSDSGKSKGNKRDKDIVFEARLDSDETIVEQTLSISYQKPVTVISMGIESGIFPGVINKIVGTLSKTIFMGLPAETVLFTSMQSDQITKDGKPLSRFKYSLEFQHDEDEWKTFAQFTEQPGQPVTTSPSSSGFVELYRIVPDFYKTLGISSSVASSLNK